MQRFGVSMAGRAFKNHLDFCNPADYHSPMITVVELPEFRRRVEDLLDEDEQKELITYLSGHPRDGVLIEGTSGVRKVRWARSGRGKSGGVRVIYFFYNESIRLFLLTIFAKNEQENLSKAERNELAVLTRLLVEVYRRKSS